MFWRKKTPTQVPHAHSYLGGFSFRVFLGFGFSSFACKDSELCFFNLWDKSIIRQAIQHWRSLVADASGSWGLVVYPRFIHPNGGGWEWDFWTNSNNTIPNSTYQGINLTIKLKWLIWVDMVWRVIVQFCPKLLLGMNHPTIITLCQWSAIQKVLLANLTLAWKHHIRTCKEPTLKAPKNLRKCFSNCGSLEADKGLCLRTSSHISWNWPITGNPPEILIYTGYVGVITLPGTVQFSIFIPSEMSMVTSGRAFYNTKTARPLQVMFFRLLHYAQSWSAAQENTWVEAKNNMILQILSSLQNSVFRHMSKYVYLCLRLSWSDLHVLETNYLIPIQSKCSVPHTSTKSFSDCIVWCPHCSCFQLIGLFCMLPQQSRYPSFLLKSSITCNCWSTRKNGLDNSAFSLSDIGDVRLKASGGKPCVRAAVKSAQKRP